MADLQFVKVRVDQEQAEAWLANRCATRSVSEPHVERIRGLMRDGLWVDDTGETIKFREDGALADGTHRLIALHREGTARWWWACSGLTQAAVDALDQGMKRSVGAIYRAQGMNYGNDFVAGLRWIDRYLRRLESGQLLPSGRSANGKIEVDRVLAVNPGFLEAAQSVGSPLGIKELLGLPAAWFIYYFAKKTSPDRAGEWIVRLNTGDVYWPGSPLQQLRDKLLKQKSGRGPKIARDVKVAMAVKSWLAFEAGSMIRVLKWDEREAFPLFRCSQPTMTPAPANAT